MKRAACYDVPAWHAMQWDEQRADLPLAATVAEEGDGKVAGFGDGLMPEVFHRLYAESPAAIDPTQRDGAAAARATLHDLASELPEWDTLRTQTVRDPMWASLATTAICESLAKALPEREDNPPLSPPDADKVRQILDGLRDMQIGGEYEARAEGNERGVRFAVAEQAEGIDPSAIRQAIRAGIEEAHAQIAEGERALAAFGAEGDTGAPRSLAVAAALARQVRSSPKLARIVALAGRLQATARAKRASRSQYARSEATGVERTGDLGRLLPIELGAIGDPLRRWDLFKRLGERAALGYKMRGKAKAAKGPLLVALDVSSSMEDHDKDAWAKAVALSVLDIARHERRAFGVCLFNGDVVESYLAPDPRRVDTAALLSLLAREPSGGTAFGPPAVWALDRMREAAGTRAFAPADLVLVTDGHAGDEGADRIRIARAKLGAVAFGIAIGSSPRGAQSLAAWCDHVTAIDDVTHDTKATDLLFEGL